MKQIILLFISTCLLLCTSCSPNEACQPDDVQIEPTHSVAVMTPELETPTASASPQPPEPTCGLVIEQQNEVLLELQEELIEVAYVSPNTKFTYDVLALRGFQDAEKEAKINQTLYEAFTGWVTDDCEWLTDSPIKLLYASTRYITIQRTKESRGNKIDTLTLNVTIDVATGEPVVWDDIIGPEETQIETLRSLAPRLNSRTDDELLEMIQTGKQTLAEA